MNALPRHLPTALALAAALALLAAPPVFACGSSPGSVGNLTFGSGGGPNFLPPPPGLQQAQVSAPIGVFAPSSPTTCVCGLGAGVTGNPAPSSLSVGQAVLTRFDQQTGQHTILTEFVPLSLNSLTTQGLANGPGLILPGGQWFGFSGLIQPFDAPALGPNEIFTLTFSLNFDPDDRDALMGLPLQFASGTGEPDGTPIFDPRLEHPVTYFGPAQLPDCLPTQNALCLNQGRFRAEVDWRIPSGATGKGTVAPCSARDAGNFWFFGPDNIEMLIKVLDACTLNNRFWVFYSATTNVEFTLTVTDTRSPRIKKYLNPLGNPAPPVQDTAAFMTCP